MNIKRKTFPIIITVVFLGLFLALFRPEKDAVLGQTIDTNIYLPLVNNSLFLADNWSMAGANPERTSWTPEEVRGMLKPEWYTHFDAYISQKVQIIAAAGKLFISASDGLHALSSDSGNEVWFYPTELPLGHSPTYSGNVVYVGGFDHKIHAINAHTGAGLWTYTAESGFQTNPLVVEGLVLAGNRDGYFYAIRATGNQQGQLAWRFKTEGPITYSAAYKDGVVYFASNDMYAYALNAQNGNLVWKSSKLGGNGFHSFWPVVYNDYVIFSGDWNYRSAQPGPTGSHNFLERIDVYPDTAQQGDPIGPYGHEPGNWASGTTTIRATAIIDYFEKKPYRRTYFMLNRFTGTEYTFDSDNDGLSEYAPILYVGVQNGTRYPPAVGPDGVIYQANNYIYNDSIPRGQVTGWKVGTPYISIPSAFTNAVDEPLGYSIGGNIVYARLCCDREAKAFDLATGEGWFYFDQGGRPLRKTFPDLFALGWDFAYWKHGDPSAPVPYNDRVYTIVNNAVVALSAQGLDPVIPPGEDLGSYRGEQAEDIEKSTIIKGLNLKTTLDNTSWPLLIYQERFYEQNYRNTVRATYTRLFEVAGASSGAPTSLTQTNTNISTHLTSTYGGTQTLHTWMSSRSPSVLLQNTGSVVQLRGKVIGLAYVSSSGVQIISGSGTIAGSSLNESWLLVWDDTDEHRWMPAVISMQNRPSEVVMNSAGLTFSYSGSAGYLGITPVYGMSNPLSGEVNTWPSSIPQVTLDRVRLLNRLARAFPLSSTENRSIDSVSGDVTIALNYQYIQFQDVWNTTPLQLAYLPPTLALAAWNGSPIRINDLPLSSHTDLNYLTPLGRIAGAANSSSVTIRLPGLANYWRDELPAPPAISPDDVVLGKLVSEVQKMLAAGHLRPSYGGHGLWDGIASARLGPYLADYYHNPAETIYTLIMALPLLPSSMQLQVQQYIQSEFQAYPPYDTSHAGWAVGSSRDYFGLPPEVVAELPSSTPCGVCNSWGFPGENIYASYLFAKRFGDAANIFNQVQDKLDDLPDFNQSYPNRLNSTVIGYIGYLRLADEAGVTPQTSIQNTAIDYLIARAALSKYPSALAGTGFEYSGYKWAVRTLSTSQPDTLFTPRIIGTLWSQMPLYGYPRDNVSGLSGGSTGGGYSFGIDFVNLVPETANFLNAYAFQETQNEVEDYSWRSPYWFVEKAEEMAGEGEFVPIYNILGLFQAKALILGESRAELEQYLDVPMIKVGDLYYMQNLIATLKANP